jgi:hypothetical protein
MKMMARGLINCLMENLRVPEAKPNEANLCLEQTKNRKGDKLIKKHSAQK